MKHSMPVVLPLLPLDEGKPDGYQESLRDWIARNEEPVRWFLEKNVKEIKR